ncbi:MAG: NAD(P)H-dependent glycerol-3-phosphate dehydrogenase [Pseudanabaena sp. M135S2SP2A07QC]|jgi:glycerol-3-phosphate dehydrogenase (NAD(P)+)|nr:NAD(P)H-dependent glycerol-3-phosphate dehydrogenase [Pseudanabaena sp. M090S1SP2A07QC]MCA6507404.1 NAD(P)H-dependent glycerol-3-phosphate dehydrogenase [Pseudanabaena sp. M172S2SP2A07QC]MCA6520377.1 NAD(P)H-dependent glycerol-3-phosphate dehydrogenase [Pseudanabaena sp. M051S1SP2A07QC]MCA6527297.1 NAD(P)H-dependent glycerol-3-phosphate dehydrogenase [Pseudanabaena sp. M179S2SP2A07QC]MCA6528767.1 NAD(P)H-dependent glycerol-3-phosphate dehydrogenase [Pseudanabaena sp. M125S2SP2A07QC]MCA65363
MKSDLKNVTIIGSGAWGSALANLVQTNQHHVQIWSRQSQVSLVEMVSNSDAIISAVSIKGVRAIAKQLQTAKLLPDAVLVSATKGLEPITRQTPSQIWRSLLPNHPLVVLSGPNLSKEIMAGQPAATVVASNDERAAQFIQHIFASRNFRVYTNSDPIGVELGGTLKNVIAIAVGACDGLNLGTNAKSALITRSLIEIIRVGVYFGAQPETFWGLSGLGDLLATCNSNLSRNYQVGYAIAQGKSLEEAITNVQGTAEGVNTANVLIEICDREKISVPVSRYVYRLLKGEITLQQSVEGLMERDLKPENLENLELPV